MPAQKHLALGTAVDEDDGGMTDAGGTVRRKKEIAMDLHTVGGGVDDRLRHNHLTRRKIRRNELWREIAELVRRRDSCRTHRGPGVGAHDRDGAIIGGDDGLGLEPIALCDSLRSGAGSGDSPDVAAFAVALIGGEYDEAAVGTERGVLHLKVAWGEQAG